MRERAFRPIVGLRRNRLAGGHDNEGWKRTITIGLEEEIVQGAAKPLRLLRKDEIGLHIGAGEGIHAFFGGGRRRGDRER
jgi:hypothetical protein